MTRVGGGGTIYQLEDKPRNKCRKWKLQVSLGRDLATGKYRRRCRNVTGTYGEAQRALRDLIAETEAGRSTTRCGDRFGDYADAWLASRRDEVADGTYRKNVDHVRCLKLHIADARLSELTPEVVELMYDGLRAGKSPSGKRLSGTYVGCIARTLHKMLHDAMRDGRIASNPCDLAQAPASDTAERRVVPFERMRELVDKLDPTHPPELVVLAGIRGGICRGEMHGLRCGDIDGLTVSITHTMDNTGKPREKTKTLYRTRRIPISKSLRAAFGASLAYMEEHGIPTGPEDPIICNDVGEWMKPGVSSQWWRRNRRALGFDGYTVHDMRHSFASKMARDEVNPKVLQRILGHGQFSTTMDIYVHVTNEQMREACDAADW